MPVTRRVPTSSGRMPNWGSWKSGDHSPSLKKRDPTSWKNGIDSFSSATTIRIVVRTEIAAAANSADANRLLAPSAAADAEGIRPRRRACRLGAGFHRVLSFQPAAPWGLSRPPSGQRPEPWCPAVVHRDDQGRLGNLVVVVGDELDERGDLRSLRAHPSTGT